MIRILHVVASLNINAGMMSVAMNHYRHIDRTQIQFDFLYFEETEETHQNEITELGGRTFFIPYPTFKRADQLKLREFFSEHKNEYTAVHCHPIWASEIIAKEAKRSGIKHIIQHCHSTRYSNKKLSAIRNKALTSVVGFFATDFVACSEEAAMLFGKKRVKNGEVTIIRNAIDIDKYKYDEQLRREFREGLGIPNSTFVIGAVGRLCVEKNQRFIIDVFCRYKKINTDSKLILVGDGPLREELESYAANTIAKDDITFTGRLTNIQMVLSGFDLFIMPSVFEGVPLSAVEAQANGLQVLLSDTITKSIKTSKTIYIPLSQPAQVWTEAVEAICESDNDRNDNSEIAVQGFDIISEADKLQNYYMSLR